jgi:hypothetical protein
MYRQRGPAIAETYGRFPRKNVILEIRITSLPLKVTLGAEV